MQNQKCLKNKIFLPCHSSVKWSQPGALLKAQFVIFRCQKYVKKGYIEMRKSIYLVPLKCVLGRSILHYFSDILLALSQLDKFFKSKLTNVSNILIDLLTCRKLLPSVK